MTPSYPREREPWPPQPPPPGAFQVQRWNAEDDDRPTSILVRHPTAPFVQDLDSGGDDALRAAARRYLSDVDDAAALGLPGWWLAALNPGEPDPHPDFGWLPVVRPEAGKPRPLGSFEVRSNPEQGRPSLTVVLLASERILAAEGASDFVLGSEFGVRVPVHVRPLDGGRVRVRITGLSASLPFGDYDSSERFEDFWTKPGERGIVEGLLPQFRASTAGTLGLDPETVFFRGFRLGRNRTEPRRIEIRGRGLSAPRTSRSDPYEFIATATVDAGLRLAGIASVTKVPLVACANETARVFRCDPASMGSPRDYRQRRPTRSEAALDSFRQEEGQADPLVVPDRARVVQTWFVLGDNPGPNPNALPPKAVGLPQPAPPPPFPPVRSNDFSAVSAFRNLREIFRRFDRYGIDPDLYFNLAALPIEGHYRSGVRPGPGKDGQTVNARVLPKGWDVNDVVPPLDNDRPLLELHLALGDLSTRARKPWNRADRSPAEPLGVAAVLALFSHETAHILMMATLGELEFRFAHSTGDALAAIVADPCSRLGDDAEFWHWRYHTFPWVFIPRRHDRCVLHGWGWRGAIGRDARRLPDADRLRRKGYGTEQIVATTLFRLYRCLGGDTRIVGWPEPDRFVRKRASDYTVYLIMTALWMLGDQRIVPAPRAEFFRDALIDVDEHTETCPTDDGQGAVVERVGGCAHKVIEWAFKAQGMDDGDPDGISNKPAPPPPVDIYIEDLRPVDEVMPAATVPHGPGTYVPVSLDWGDAGAPPLWFAHANSITQAADGGVTVRVANRGTAAAQGVRVTVWWRPWPAAQPVPPAWDVNDPGWVFDGPSPAQNIGPGAAVAFGPFARPAGLPAERCIVLAQADCADDLSNIDSGLDLAPMRYPTPLNELVPFDNNLGLAVFPAP